MNGFNEKIIITLFGLSGAGKSHISDALQDSLENCSGFSLDDFGKEFAMTGRNPKQAVLDRIMATKETCIIIDFAYPEFMMELLEHSHLIVFIDGDLETQIRMAYKRPKNAQVYEGISFF